MWKPDICIYHGNCDDGFGAAWAIWKRWGDDVTYVPGTYGKALPDVTGKNVLFVDFSAKRPEIEVMAQVAKSIVIIDHHKTAEADLEPFNLSPLCGGGMIFNPEDLNGTLGRLAEINRPPVLAWFDMEQSGAVLAWKFARPGPPVPFFLELIQDRDLWKFEFAVTKRFSAALRTYSQEFNLWDKLAEAGSTEHLINEGAGILRSHSANIQKFIAEAYMDFIAGYSVPVVNVPYHYASDTAHELLQKYKDAHFAACWFRRGDWMIQYSLRSEDRRVDVSEVAKKFGGGGHRNAAGYQVPA